MISPQYNSHQAIQRICILIALSTTGIILAMSENIGVAMVGIFVLGSMFAHAVELQHQCLHYSAFKSRKANRIIGVILGLPTLTSFHAYRRSHLEHHRNLGSSEDIPFFNYRFVTSPSLGALLFDLFGVAHLRASISAIFGNGDSRLISLPQGDEPTNNSERLDYALMGFMLVFAALTTMIFGPAIVLKIWIVPFLFVAQPLHFLIELPEHIGCNEKSTEVFHNTRTIVGSRFSRWFTNFNNLHVEHHLEPTISMDRLPAIFGYIQGQHLHLEQTYWQFYRSLYKSIAPESLTIASNNRAGRSA